jgi:hypothetical protein
LQIDCSRNKAVFATQTAVSKQPSMGSFWGTDLHFLAAYGSYISISLWQFYGTHMVAIIR